VIYPTRRLILLVAAGAPVALLIGVIAPGFWLVGPAWVLACVGAALADAALGADRHRLRIDVASPHAVGLGGAGRSAEATLAFAGAVPSSVETALEANERFDVDPPRRTLAPAGRTAEATFALNPLRRGKGRLNRLWVRWRGPLGLVWKQRAEPLDRAIPITPGIDRVKDDAARLFSRTSPVGLKTQLDTGEGSEFHALQEFRPGLDKRLIDWKRSARHGRLYAREQRVERNHPVILCLDAGRTMSEPVGGVPRVDRALTAALLLAYAGLKLGDRVGLFAFDAKPRLSSGQVTGVQAFAHLQRLAAGIDYSSEESSYTLALTTLSGELLRRSLVVIFTEVADLTQAELMLETVGRLVKRHVLLFVLFRDEELESLAAAPPTAPQDVSRAVVAAALLRRREAVILRLRRMGVEVVDAPAERVGPALINAYLDIKRRERV